MSQKKPPPTVYEDDDGPVPAAAQGFPPIQPPPRAAPLAPMPRAGFPAAGGPRTIMDEEEEVAQRLMGFLVVMQSRGEDEYRYFRLKKGVNWVGRFGSRAEIELRDTEVSERHAIVVCTNNATRLVDLDSSNGSFVNGEKAEFAEVKEGDMIKFGRTTTVFVPFTYIGED